MARPNLAIYSALGADILIAITKFAAGIVSRSSAMIAEGVHSLVDTVNELLLLYGIHRSNKERDEDHPFGYGRELYFWSFIVSILIFSFGAGVAFVQGYLHLKQPAAMGSMTWNYIVLGFSFLFEGISFLIAFRKFRKTTQQPMWTAIIESKDPTDFIVLFEDGAAVVGVVVVFVLLYIGERTGNPYLDGIASLVVGVILTVASMLLARESRSLLIGEGISERTKKGIIDIVHGGAAGFFVKRLASIYEGPDEVLLVLILEVRPELATWELTDRMDEIKAKIKERYPRITYIIIQPE
ncbi:MAG TPA: cation diffusion facilitator family transporter [Puia sp.]|nr:cation diffusion facilitator family transporter [Puia sp.]